MIYKAHDPTIFYLGISTVTLLTTFYIYKKIFSKNWKLVGHLKEIHFYPIKSCAVVNVSEAECDIMGLKKGQFNDRIFMITDNNGKYQSGRSIAKLVKIRPHINENILTLRADNVEDFIIDLEQVKYSKNVVQCNIWNDIINVIDCGTEVAEWISKVILNKNIGLKLVYYPHTKTNRSIRQKFTVSSAMTMKDLGAFSDGSSYMLATNSSLNDLNSRVPEYQTKINQFRPNFVVKGTQAHDEDNWKMVKIGNSATFACVLPCTRCHFVNVNPITGVSHENEEPLKTLKTYRQVTDKALKKIVGISPKMGVQMGLRRKGKIQIGDPVYVIY